VKSHQIIEFVVGPPLGFSPTNKGSPGKFSVEKCHNLLYNLILNRLKRGQRKKQAAQTESYCNNTRTGKGWLSKCW
jgi:hypothetical protein